MAYRSQVKARERAGAIAVVAAIHAALLIAVLNLAGRDELPPPQSALKIFNLAKPPSPPPLPPPPEQRRHARPKLKEGSSAPRNIKSQATPVVAPRPQIRTPPVQPIVASATPRQGSAATQGSSSIAGPGTGAGGSGNGTGSGAGGNGPGGGGDNGVAEPPQLVTPVLRGRDIPGELLDQWPSGATVFLRLQVDASGYVAGCTIDRGTGAPAIDHEMCDLVYQRLRFRPALNRSGQAVAGWFGYAQPAPR